ncbi:hypothetical protein MA16_Dca012417 [Dendrobium catenatum]|uniref:Ysc84 actin-binding domain-containing protein n=1 Tax=Dendrobium catenatum TaxID=906689 RepID=A0A2I0WYD0_9ASPA|nr:hypothetical protein MA16_Dca012417 [Dendrobium catenatum]
MRHVILCSVPQLGTTLYCSISGLGTVDVTHFGAFLGCSLEGSMLTTRTLENCRFYGSSTINASDILLGTLPRPPAAALLYNALSDLFQKLKT